jgi:hypothetical protein
MPKYQTSRPDFSAWNTVRDPSGIGCEIRTWKQVLPFTVKVHHEVKPSKTQVGK